MSRDPYQDDRGNKDRSITKAHGVGETPLRKGGKAVKVEGETPFLIGDTMTGGYGKGPDILHDCTIAVNAGEIAVIVGPNGSGKSTLLGMMGAMNAPTFGRFIVDDIDIYSLGQEQRADFRREFLGFIFQSFHLVSYLTVIENTMLPLAVVKAGKKQKLEIAQEALSQVGLLEKAHRLPNQISGGEKEARP